VGGAAGGGGSAAEAEAGWRAGRRGELLPYGDGVPGGDQDQFIGLAQAVAVVFGVELGKAEAGFGHLACFGQGQRQLAAGAAGQFGGEGGHGDLGDICSCFVLDRVGVGV
jgi:hypothetical protein